MAQTRLKSGNLHMVGGDNGSDGNVLKSKGDGTMEWGTAINPPTFSSVDYPGDDTALDPAGNQSLIINGGTFISGITVTIGGTAVSSVTLNSGSQITVTTPAKSAGTYDIVFTNTNGGTATASNAVSYNGIPAFTNAAGSLGSVLEGASMNFSVAATEPDGGTITYAITSGALPSGGSLNTSTGAITGTAGSVSADTTSSFTITATDNENQSTSRAYSITVTNETIASSFNIITYTGNATARSITGVGFKPDLVLTKATSFGEKTNVFDSTRGVQKRLYLNGTHSEATQTNSLTSFDADGFSIGDWTDMNTNNATFVSYCFKANGGTTSTNNDGSIATTIQVNNSLGFSIIKFTGNNTNNATIGHGLSSTPEFWIMKNLPDAGYKWPTHVQDVGSLSGAQTAAINEQSAFSSYSKSATSSVITLANGQADRNPSSKDMIVYAFHSVDGFSKFGTYTGNGLHEGPIVNTGFEPGFLMVKKAGASDNWIILDNKRSPANERNEAIFANLSDSQYANYAAGADFYSNGFQMLTTDNGFNQSGDQYFYMAIATPPDTSTPSLADSFSSKTYTGTGGSTSITGIGFEPGLIWMKRSSSAQEHALVNAVSGPFKYLYADLNSAEGESANSVSSFDSDGWSMGANGLMNNGSQEYKGWVWKSHTNEPTIMLSDYFTFDVSDPAADNCSDQGDYIVGTKTKDFIQPVYVKSAFIYASFAGLRASNVTIQYSDDNSNWTTAYTTTMSNNAACGLHYSGNHAAQSDASILAHGAHRYWRYVEGSAITSHHPRYSRMGFVVAKQAVVSVNNNAGFSIVKWTGDGETQSKVPHGLGAAPDVIIMKRRDANGGGWDVVHSGLSSTHYVNLHTGSAQTNSMGNDGGITNGNQGSTNFGFTKGNNTTHNVNTNSAFYIAYCWRSITGYSKFGVYSTNAGTKITTGFEPTFMIFKSRGSGNWYMQDLNDWDGSTTGSNNGKLLKKYYQADTDTAQQTVGTGGVEIVSDGFYPTNWFDTTNGVIYFAWKAN